MPFSKPTAAGLATEGTGPEAATHAATVTAAAIVISAHRGSNAIRAREIEPSSPRLRHLARSGSSASGIWPSVDCQAILLPADDSNPHPRQSSRMLLARGKDRSRPAGELSARWATRRLKPRL